MSLDLHKVKFSTQRKVDGKFYPNFFSAHHSLVLSDSVGCFKSVSGTLRMHLKFPLPLGMIGVLSYRFTTYSLSSLVN